MTSRLVLCYHAISPTWDAQLSVRPELFERQLNWWARHGWRGVTFGELVAGDSSGKRIAVTFDDAFRSVFTYARPILDELRMPATVFAPTAFMGEPQPLSWAGIDHWAATEHAKDLESMSWEDLGVLASEGWEIGSHTRTHPLLTRLDDAAAATELEQSRDEIERALGTRCRSVAYPYGGVDARILEIARSSGYLSGAGLSRSLSRNGPLEWPRLGIYHADDWARFIIRSNALTRALRRSPLWPESVPASGVSFAK